ncbi:unnamed protein product [Prunus armeniaca]
MLDMGVDPLSSFFMSLHVFFLIFRQVSTYYPCGSSFCFCTSRPNNPTIFIGFYLTIISMKFERVVQGVALELQCRLLFTEDTHERKSTMSMAQPSPRNQMAKP